MNERNVAALAGLLEWATAGMTDPRTVAVALAARGVLVPSALTDGECQQIHEESTDDYDRGCFLVREFIAELERIAKGEA